MGLAKGEGARETVNRCSRLNFLTVHPAAMHVFINSWFGQVSFSIVCTTVHRLCFYFLLCVVVAFFFLLLFFRLSLSYDVNKCETSSEQTVGCEMIIIYGNCKWTKGSDVGENEIVHGLFLLFFDINYFQVTFGQVIIASFIEQMNDMYCRQVRRLGH